MTHKELAKELLELVKSALSSDTTEESRQSQARQVIERYLFDQQQVEFKIDLERMLLDKIKFIGEGEHTYYGTPNELIKHILETRERT